MPYVPTVMIPNPEYDAAFGGVAGAAPMIAAKLGRVTPKSRPATARLTALFSPAEQRAVAPPPSTNRRAKAGESMRRMYRNDREGNCVIAGKFHTFGLWTANDTPVCKVVSDNTVSAYYQRLKAGPGDSGCVVTVVLDFLAREGFRWDDGTVSKLDGYVAVDWRNKLEVMVAVYLFGSITLAYDHPGRWSAAEVWDGPQTGIVGGHDVSLVDYDEQYAYVSTWGSIRKLTWAALANLNRNTELYAMVGPDWYNADRLSPTGLSVESLKKRLEIIGGSDLPDTDPDAPPAPPTPPPAPPVPTPPPTPDPVPPAPPAPPKPDPVYDLLLKIAMTDPAGSGVGTFGAMPSIYSESVWVFAVEQVLAAKADLPPAELAKSLAASKPAALSFDEWLKLIELVLSILANRK